MRTIRTLRLLRIDDIFLLVIHMHKECYPVLLYKRHDLERHCKVKIKDSGGKFVYWEMKARHF